MDELNRYSVILTRDAMDSLEKKAAYIRDEQLAVGWYRRLRGDLVKELSYLPYKYPVYNKGKWAEAGVHILTIRNDIVLYEIDEDNAVVYIRNVFSRGKDLSKD